MKILAVESASPLQSVAVLEGDAVRAEVRRQAGGSHAKWIIPHIDEVLARAALPLEALEGLAVSIGPGSFTGIRVGVATMLGLRDVTGLPLAGVSALEALAWNVHELGTVVCAMLKGRTGEAYWARFRWDRLEEPTRLDEPRVGPYEEICQAIDGPTAVVGDGWLAYREPLLERLGGRESWIREGSDESSLPTAVSVGRAARRRLEQGFDEPVGFSPLYVQRSEAEIVWERRHPPLHDGETLRNAAATGGDRRDGR